MNRSDIVKIVLITIIIILIIAIIVYMKKRNNQRLNENFEDPIAFDTLSNAIYSDLLTQNPELLPILKNDLLKLDEMRNTDMQSKSFQIKSFESKITAQNTQQIIDFILFWVQNEIILRYTLEISLLMVCVIYEKNKLITGDRHQTLLQEKLDQFVYFFKNSIVYLFYIKNIASGTPNELQIDMVHLLNQIKIIRQEKLKLNHENINNHYDILKNNSTNYQTSTKLLINECRLPSTEPGQIIRKCHFDLFADSIFNYMNIILNDPTNPNKNAFSGITLNDNALETVIKPTKDYFGNSLNFPDTIQEAKVSFNFSTSNYTINTAKITQNKARYAAYVNDSNTETTYTPDPSEYTQNTADYNSENTPQPNQNIRVSGVGTPQPSEEFANLIEGFSVSLDSVSSIDLLVNTALSVNDATNQSLIPAAPATSDTSAPTTSASTTPAPATSDTSAPTTSASTTPAPATSAPATSAPTTPAPTTPAPLPPTLAPTFSSTPYPISGYAQNLRRGNGINISLIDDVGPNNFFLPRIHIRKH